MTRNANKIVTISLFADQKMHACSTVTLQMNEFHVYRPSFICNISENDKMNEIKTTWLVQETEQCNYSGGPKHAAREGDKRNKQP